MPEGHTVHRLARTFDHLFRDEAVSVTSPQGRFADGAAVLNGSPLLRAEAFGKQMFLGFGPDPAATCEVPDEDLNWLRVHLGLYGSWTFAGDGSISTAHAIGAPRKRIGEQERVLDDAASAPAFGTVAVRGPNAVEAMEWVVPEPRGQVRARILGTHAVADLTGPTACEVLNFPEMRRAAAKLGPDPLRSDADPQRFIDQVRRSRIAVGQQLMNQSVIAGVGNIYRAEALFRAHVDPYLPGNLVPEETLRAMWDDLVVLMEYGVKTGAIVTTEPEDRDKGMDPAALAEASGRRAVTRQNTDGDPDAVPRDRSFYVYHRHGQPCRICGTTVSIADMQARKLYWCPTCQN
jgi:endonuclease-8